MRGRTTKEKFMLTTQTVTLCTLETILCCLMLCSWLWQYCRFDLIILDKRDVHLMLLGPGDRMSKDGEDDEESILKEYYDP